jgi:hypothetical protein
MRLFLFLLCIVVCKVETVTTYDVMNCYANLSCLIFATSSAISCITFLMQQYMYGIMGVMFTGCFPYLVRCDGEQPGVKIFELFFGCGVCRICFVITPCSTHVFCCKRPSRESVNRFIIGPEESFGYPLSVEEEHDRGRDTTDSNYYELQHVGSSNNSNNL